MKRSKVVYTLSVSFPSACISSNMLGCAVPFESRTISCVTTRSLVGCEWPVVMAKGHAQYCSAVTCIVSCVYNVLVLPLFLSRAMDHSFSLPFCTYLSTWYKSFCHPVHVLFIREGCTRYYSGYISAFMDNKKHFVTNVVPN